MRETGSLRHMLKFLHAAAQIDNAAGDPRIANLCADFLDTLTSLLDESETVRYVFVLMLIICLIFVFAAAVGWYRSA